jgi:hypothetical protein
MFGSVTNPIGNYDEIITLIKAERNKHLTNIEQVKEYFKNCQGCRMLKVPLKWFEILHTSTISLVNCFPLIFQCHKHEKCSQKGPFKKPL